MSYATPEDLLFYGAAAQAQLSTPDWVRTVPAELLVATIHGQAVDAWPADQQAAAQDAVNRLNDALRSASAEIDAALAQRYPLPFVGPAWAVQLLRECCRAIARWLLTDDIGRYDESGRPLDPAAERAAWARKQLAAIQAGKLLLASEPPDTVGSPAAAVGRLSFRSDLERF